MENGHAIKVLDYLVNAHVLMELEVGGIQIVDDMSNIYLV
jgi:hypothetical protein